MTTNAVTTLDFIRPTKADFMPGGIGQAVHSIRVVTIDGAPWFVAADLPSVLGFTTDNLKYHLKKNINSTEKTILKKSQSSLTTLPLFAGKVSWLTLISESGLYKLIMRSDKPQAKAFQDWVTQEVLPSIRKTGSFVTGQASLVENPTMDSLDLMMQQAQIVS